MAHIFIEKKQLMHMILLLMIVFMFVCPAAYAQKTPEIDFGEASQQTPSSVLEYAVSPIENDDEPSGESSEESDEKINVSPTVGAVSKENGQGTAENEPEETHQNEATAEPTVRPTAEPTVKPTAEPTVTPSPKPENTPVPEPQVRFSRDFSTRYAEAGSLVTLSYTVRNDGVLPMTDITVRDGLLGKVGSIARLDPGEKKTFSVRVKVTETCTSSPSISYKYAGESRSKRCSEKNIYLASVRLRLELEADKMNMLPGEYVTLRISMKNEGNVNLYALQIKEPILGEIGSPLRSLAPNEERVVTRTVQMKGTATFRFTVAGSSDTGEAFEIEADDLTVVVTPEAAQIEMELDAKADRMKLDAPGEVNFSLRLNNRCVLELRDVVLSESTRGEVRRLAFVPSGEVPPIEWSCYAAESGSYRFKAQVTDAAGDQVTVYSQTIYISVGDQNPQTVQEDEPQDSDLIDVPGGAPYRMAEEAATFERLIVRTVVLLVAVLLLWYMVFNVRSFIRQMRRHRRKVNRGRQNPRRTGGRGR